MEASDECRPATEGRCARCGACWKRATCESEEQVAVMNYVYPRPGPDDAFIETVEPYQGGLIQIDTRSYIEWSIFCFGAYDRATVELLTTLVRPGCVVLDVGANVGVVSSPTSPASSAPRALCMRSNRIRRCGGGSARTSR